MNITNKKSLQSFHRVYKFLKKNNIIEKVKKKFIKINIFKKEIIHKIYKFSQLNLLKKNVLWIMTHFMKWKLQIMMNSKSDINFLCLNIVITLKLILLFSVKDAVDINQQLMNTYNIYYEQIFIYDDNKKICKHCKFLISINIKLNMILEVIWLI